RGLTGARLPARIGHRHDAEQRVERRRTTLLERPHPATGGTGPLRREILLHLLGDQYLLNRIQDLLALLQRQSQGRASRFSALQLSNVVQVFGAIVRDSDDLDTEVHQGCSSRHSRSAVLIARRSNGGVSSSRSRSRSRASAKSRSSVVGRGPP